VVLGAGLSFVMNQLENYLSLGAAWYMKVGPILNILVGGILMYLGFKAKLFKSEKMQYFAVAGGAAMVANGINKLVERGMASTGMIPAPSGRAFVNGRAPGQLPYRMVEETKVY